MEWLKMEERQQTQTKIGKRRRSCREKVAKKCLEETARRWNSLVVRGWKTLQRERVEKRRTWKVVSSPQIDFELFFCLSLSFVLSVSVFFFGENRGKSQWVGQYCEILRENPRYFNAMIIVDEIYGKKGEKVPDVLGAKREELMRGIKRMCRGIRRWRKPVHETRRWITLSMFSHSQNHHPKKKNKKIHQQKVRPVTKLFLVCLSTNP